MNKDLKTNIGAPSPKCSKHPVLSALARVVYKSAERNANQTSVIWDYQPTLPQCIKDLKKHK